MPKTNNFSFAGFTSFIKDHPFLMLIIPLIFIVYPMATPGVILFGDFPLLETSLFSYKFLSTWNEYGSHFSFETLPRYPLIVFGYFLNYLQIGGDLISKFLVILGFATASFSFYFSFVRFFKNRMNSCGTFCRIGAIIGGLFYAYNVWSFHRIHHWYLWLGYAILPLFLMLLYSGFKYPIKWKYVISAVLVWTLVSGYPHMVLFYGLFYLGFSIFFILRAIRNKESVFILLKPILLILILYTLFNLYWIYPYFMYILYSGQGLAPSIYVTQEYTEHLSADSNFLNVFRLLEDTWVPRIIDVKPPAESLLYFFWLVASFVFPILAFSTLILKKHKKYVLTFSILGIIGIFLALGTNAPYDFYLILLFDIPLPSILKFILREPDKWAFLIGLSYSFLLGIFVFEFLKKAKALKYRNITSICFIFLILSSFILYAFPTYNSMAKRVLDPVILPSEFKKLNTYLQNATSNKVFFMAEDFTPKKWNKERHFCCLDEISSGKPNIDTYYPASENYHNYMTNSILNGKNKNMSNLIFPLGTSYLIYSNDELHDIPLNSTKFLEEVSLVSDLRNVNNIGFFKLYKTETTSSLGAIHIPKQIMLMNGGLDSFTSLNSLPSFSSSNSSIFYLDQNLDNKQKFKLANSADYLILGKEGYDFDFSFIDDKYVIAPYDFTNHGGISNAWSRDSAISTGYGIFHIHSMDLGIESWNFDYGKGLAISETPGANLTIPIGIGDENDDSSNYNLFMRFWKNQKGGSVNIKVDNVLLNEINTLDRISNKLVWDQIAVLNLTKGQHQLTLENVAGFNAVNILALVPSEELNSMNKMSNLLVENKSRLAYIMEAESNFYNNKGMDAGVSQYLFQNETGDNADGTVLKSITGQFKVPRNADLVSLEFTAQNITDSNSFYSIRDLRVIPENLKYSTFSSNFETKNETAILVDLRQFNWTNKDTEILSVSEANESLEGESLKVDIKQGNFTHWSVISTDFVPVIENTAYNITLGVSAKDVNQLHSKVYYFDSNMTEISSDFIFGGKDGTFEGNLSKAVSPPPEAKFVELQLWVKPNISTHSVYSLDNVGITKILRDLNWENKDTDILSVSEANETLEGESLKVDIKQGNFTHWGVISTDFIPINTNAFYDLSFEVLAKDVNQFHSKVYYFDDNLNGIQLKGREDFVSDGQDGNFREKYYKYVTPPLGAKYIQLQLWVKPNIDVRSTYSMDNVNINEILPSITYDSSFGRTGTINNEPSNVLIPNSNSIVSNNKNDANFGHSNELFEMRVNKTNPSHLYSIQTKPFSVENNHVYNYSMTLEGKNVKFLNSLASFRNSTDVIQDLSKYGNNASGGSVITMSPGSEIFTLLDVIKPSNYTIALRASTCETCTFLNLTLTHNGDKDKNISTSLRSISLPLNNKNSELKWLYSNTSFPLKKGAYELKIHSNSESDLDSIVLYSVGNDISNDGILGNVNDQHNISSLESFFNHESLVPAYISKFEKISSTKYIVDIKNATRPFVILYPEAYDSLWTASVSDATTKNDAGSNYRTNSVPVYSFINGFFINKTGNYTLTIEYPPQEWFNNAGIVSLLTFIVALAAYFVGRRWKFISNPLNRNYHLLIKE